MTAAPQLPTPRSLAEARVVKRRRAPAHLRLLPLFDRATTPMTPLQEALADYCDAAGREPGSTTVPAPPLAWLDES